MWLFGKTKTSLVVDVAALLRSKGIRGAAAPRQQIQVLRILARFVQREKLSVTAVMAGRPLDKAPHNRIFEGVRVRYAKSDTALAGELLKTLKQAGSEGVLVTEDTALEKRAHRAGGKTMRVSTFRKTLDEGGESSGENRPRPPRPERGPRPERAPQPQPAEESRDQEPAGNDDVSRMIDLVE